MFYKHFSLPLWGPPTGPPLRGPWAPGERVGSLRAEEDRQLPGAAVRPCCAEAGLSGAFGFGFRLGFRLAGLDFGFGF